MSDNENGAPVSSQNEDTPHTDIDTEQLISEVKKRPFLYEKSYAEFIERETNRKLWLEVCQATVEKWNEYDTKKKKEKAKEVQSKWRSLKDNFLKKLVGLDILEPCNKKRKHFESLSFLIPTMPDQDVDIQAENNNGTELEFVMDTIRRQETREEIMPSTSSQKILSAASSQSVSNLNGTLESTQAKQTQEPIPSVQEPIPAVQEPIPAIQEPTPAIQESMQAVQEQMPAIQEPMSDIQEQVPPDQEHMSAIQEQMLPAQEHMQVVQERISGIQEPIISPSKAFISEEPKEDSICENTHFSLMLVPMMRKFNYDQKYYARTEILRIMSQVSHIGQERICILQNELKYPETEGETSLMADVNYAIEENPGSSLQGDHTYPAPLPRPRNEQGELQYPETDNEDEVDV